ncbi:craniofacial development protein 2-like [Amphiura filiformis]|uniref:craniofacial development protein 2-like n=1 Tax=Amphiura filiformis TaxID=82378 RepID=UPI003B21C760
MIAKDIQILGVSELWWLGQGRFTTDGGNMVIYSGMESGKKRKGVGFIVEKPITKSVIGYNPVNERVMTLRLQGSPINISVMQVYAPTTDAPDSEIMEFHEMIQGTLDSIPKRDLLIVLGDWNAKIGKSSEESDIVGKHGLGTRNERGDILYDFCAINNLVIGNTLFEHHPRRLWTWSSPGDRTRNQIDYIMVQKRWRSTLQNVRTRPSADCGSDHQLLVVKLKLRLKAKKGSRPPIRYDVDNIPVQYAVEVKNKFEQLMK